MNILKDLASLKPVIHISSIDETNLILQNIYDNQQISPLSITLSSIPKLYENNQ
jgi:hypothetical protein